MTTAFGLKLLTPAAAEPLSLAEAKAHLRVSWCEDDEDIGRKLAEAVRDSQRECGRQFCSATWRMTLDDFPRRPRFGTPAMAAGRPPLANVIEVPLPPLQSVTAVRYYATDGTLATIDPAAYWVDADGEPGRVISASGLWPAVQCGRPAAVQVEFVAGFGTPADVPADVKGAIKIVLADRWLNRGDDAKADRPIPAGAVRVLTAYRGHLT